MLCLSRKPGQKFIIEVNGKRIEVVICGVQGNRVKVGIDAADDVRIHREELEEVA